MQEKITPKTEQKPGFSLFELFRSEKSVTLSVTHPGITFTNITAHYPKLIFAVIKHPMKVIFMKTDKASLSIVKGVFVKVIPGCVTERVTSVSFLNRDKREYIRYLFEFPYTSEDFLRVEKSIS